ncbi:hypothetical protein JTB14_026973 [Gonioctena quinquepunctata]|nr:hypothetical protein JTB14_026973 [Gonioctena quinquepunctata]
MCEKAKRYRLVGYENGSKAYRLLDESTGRISISRDVKILEDYHSGYHQSKTIENIKNDHEPQTIDDEVEIFVKNKKEDVISDEIFGEQEIFDEGETEDIISGEMHSDNEGGKKDENSNSKKNKKIKNCKGGDTMKLRRSEKNNKGKPPNKFTEDKEVEEILIEPKTRNKALEGKDAKNWIDAMDEEILAMKMNNTRSLSELPEEKTAIGRYYKNRNSNDDKFRNEDINRSAIGALLYLSVNTRPDICVATSILGRNVSDPIRLIGQK